MSRKFISWRDIVTVAALFANIFRAEETSSQPTGLEVFGVCKISHCNPYNGKVYFVETNDFRVRIGSQGYSLWATNWGINRGGRPWWTQIIFDGTNTFVVAVSTEVVEEKVAGKSTLRVQPKKGFPLSVTICTGPLLRIGSCLASEEYVWLMYCFSPRRVMPDSRGVITNQFFTRRYSVASTGWRTEVKPSECGNFASSFRMVRDSTLDRATWQQEMLREEIDTPETIGEWNAFFEDLESRKRIPDGFVKLEYECREQVHTNGWSIPLVGTFRVMQPSLVQGRKFPLKTVEIRATSVRSVTDLAISAPTVNAHADVYDYRYRKVANGRIFPVAHYVLKPGEGFGGTNDPELLAKAERALRRGRKYYEPPVSGKHKVLWVVAVVLAVPPVVYLLYRWRSGGSVRG